MRLWRAHAPEAPAPACFYPNPMVRESKRRSRDGSRPSHGGLSPRPKRFHSCRERGEFDNKAVPSAVPRYLVSLLSFRRSDANAGQFCRPVAGPNATAMSFNNLAGNRQAQTRILTEALAWPVRVKSLKNALERMWRDARPVIVDSYDNMIAELLALRFFARRRALERHAHDAARFAK